MTETITALTNSTHPIEDVRQLAKLAYPTAPRMAARMRSLANILKDSEKVLLPNRCELLDPESVGQAHLDLLRLPYPYAALEAPWEGAFEPEYGAAEQKPATRRIAICWQVDPALPSFFGETGDPLNLAGTEGVCILPIYRVAGARGWTRRSRRRLHTNRCSCRTHFAGAIDGRGWNPDSRSASGGRCHTENCSN